MASARTMETEQGLESEEACVNKLHLNKEEIQIINSGDIVPEENDDFNKFLGCYYQKMGWQDGSTGKIIWDNCKTSVQKLIVSELKAENPAVKMLVKHLILRTATECQNNPPPKGKTHGQTAARVQNCVMRKLKEILEE